MWQQTIVTCLEELSDTERQERAWLNKELDEFPSPAELVCQLFDDSGLDDMLEAGVMVFSPECDALLVKIGQKVAGLKFDQPIESLLEDCVWHEIRSMAEIAHNEIRKAANGANSSEI